MKWKRLLPLAVIVILMGLAYWFGLHEALSFDQLKRNRELLIHYRDSYPLSAPLLFTLFYAVGTALWLPSMSLVSVFGGFLFPQPYVTAYVVIGATAGATILFSAAKTALGEWLIPHAESRLYRMQRGFQEGEVSYMLFLRLVPLFPFWLVNVAPAFFGVRLFTFFWTTFLGIIPGAFVYTQAGVGLGSILEKGEAFSLGTLLTREMQIALVALGFFALLPLIARRWKRRFKG